MQFGTKSGNPAKTRCQCIIAGIYENNKLSDTAKQLDRASGGYIRKMLNRGELKGKPGQSLILHDVPDITAPRVLLVGLGNIDTADPARFVQVANAAISALRGTPAKSALCCLLDVAAGDKDAYWKTRRIVERFEDGVYKFTDMKGKPPENNGIVIESVDLQIADRSEQELVEAGIDDAAAVSAGINAHKNLANTPGNVCTPTYMAEAARSLAKQYPSVTTTVIEEKEMEKLGMGAFMSVTRGSDQPGKLIVMQYKGAKPKDQPYVLVGKGISFDTGGISLFGTITTVAMQELPINVVGVIAAAENMPSGKASRPGDIVKSLSGQTIEILNTDAEGRLVLCDALTFVDRYKPVTVIDIATLTGAAVIALGSPATAMYANDDALAGELTGAGEDTLDRVWRMPLWEEYQSQLNSSFADMQNIGGREAGSVTAACFLSRFTKKYRWAHLDIAGSAFRGSGANKGATGRPVGLLTQYLMNMADAETGA
jgi:leucyl aminopeptidase